MELTVKPILLSVIVGLIGVFLMASSHAFEKVTSVPKGWQTLESPQAVWPAGKGAIYYTFATPKGTKVHLVVVNYRGGEWAFKPAVNEGETAPTSVQAAKTTCSAATNAGYFN